MGTHTHRGPSMFIRLHRGMLGFSCVFLFLTLLVFGVTANTNDPDLWDEGVKDSSAVEDVALVNHASTWSLADNGSNWSLVQNRSNWSLAQNGSNWSNWSLAQNGSNWSNWSLAQN